jgi:chromosome segregation protein
MCSSTCMIRKIHWKSSLNEAEKEYYAIRGHIDELENQVREIQKQKENIDTLLIELRDKLNDLKLELNSIRERLSIEFNINLEDIKEDLPDQPDLSARKNYRLK